MFVLPYYMVFIKYCVFSKILKYISDSGLSLFPLGVSGRSKPSPCSRTCRVQKYHNILRKNTIFNEHPVEDSNNTRSAHPSARAKCLMYVVTFYPACISHNNSFTPKKMRWKFLWGMHNACYAPLTPSPPILSPLLPLLHWAGSVMRRKCCWCSPRRPTTPSSPARSAGSRSSSRYA